MNAKKFRFLFVVLAMLIAVSCVFVGCKKKDEKKDDVLNTDSIYPIIKPEYQDEIKFTMMAPSYYTLDIDWKNNLFFKRMEELTGVKFDFQVYNDEQYAIKKSTSLSAISQMPDFFMKAMFDKTEIIRYGSQELIIPLENYIDSYMPNLKGLMANDPIIRQTITAPDGHIYSLPYVGEKGSYSFTGMPWINTQWLKNLDLNMPTTPEEFKAVLRAFRDNDPNGNGKKDEIPMLIAGDFEMSYIFSFFGIDAESYFQVKSNGEVEFGPETERYKKALKYISELYSEGLLRSDYETYTISEKWVTGAKGNINTVGFFIDYAAYAVVGYDRAGEYETLNTVKNEYTGKAGWYGSYAVTDGLFVITSKCLYPEVLCRWIDAMYDPNYAIWAVYGKEGEEWKWDNAEKTSWSFLIPASERSAYMSKATIQGGGNMPYLGVSDDFLSKCSESAISDTAKQSKRMQTIGFDGFPKIYLKNNIAIKQASVMYGDISKYIESVKNDAIKKGDITAAYKDYDSYKKQMKIAEFMKFYQEGYNIYQNNK